MKERKKGKKEELGMVFHGMWNIPLDILNTCPDPAASQLFVQLITD